MLRSSIVRLALFTIVACQQPAERTDQATEPVVDTAAETDSIHRFADRYEQAYNAGDAAALVAMYTEDAIAIVDGTLEPARDGIRNAMETIPRGTTLSVDHERTVVAASGDVAYDMGTTTVTLPAPGGGATPLTQRYIVALRKVDGEWKLDAVMASAPIGPSGVGETPTGP